MKGISLVLVSIYLTTWLAVDVSTTDRREVLRLSQAWDKLRLVSADGQACFRSSRKQFENLARVLGPQVLVEVGLGGGRLHIYLETLEARWEMAYKKHQEELQEFLERTIVCHPF